MADKKATSPVVDQVKQTVSMLKTYYEDHINPRWIKGYRDYLQSTVVRALKVKGFQTNVKFPLIKAYSDALFAGIYDNNFSFGVTGTTEEFHKQAKKVKNLGSWAFSRSNSRVPVMEACKEAVVLGNGYFRKGFTNKTKKIKLRGGGTKDIPIQYPHAKYVSCFDVFHATNVSNITESPYVIYRRSINISKIESEYSAMLSKEGLTDLKSKLQAASNKQEYFYSYDFSRVKFSAFWDETSIMQSFNSYVKNKKTEVNPLFMNVQDSPAFIDFLMNDYLSLKYSDKFVELIEYWYEDKLCLIVNGQEIYNGNNPLPDGNHPFEGIILNKIPGLPFGRGLALGLSDLQDMTDTLINLTMDNMKMLVAPMFQKLKGGGVFKTTNGRLEFDPFKVVETNQPKAITRLELGVPGFDGVNFIQFLLQMAELSEGINSYGSGYQNKVERSATGVTALVKSYKARLLPLVESLNVALSNTLQSWIAYCAYFMDESVEIQLKTDEGNVKFDDIDMEKIIGEYQVTFDSQALKTASREIKRENLMAILQMIFQAGMDPNTGEFAVDVRPILRELFDTVEMDGDKFVLSSKQVSKIKLAAAKKEVDNQIKVTKYQEEKMAESGGGAVGGGEGLGFEGLVPSAGISEPGTTGGGEELPNIAEQMYS